MVLSVGLIRFSTHDNEVNKEETVAGFVSFVCFCSNANKLGNKGNREIHACRAGLSRRNSMKTEAGEGGKHTKMIEPQKNTENTKIKREFFNHG